MRSSFGVVLGVAFGIFMILLPRMIYFQDYAVTMAGGSEEIKTASTDRSSPPVGASPLALIIATGSAAALIAYLSAKRREQGIQ